MALGARKVQRQHLVRAFPRQPSILVKKQKGKRECARRTKHAQATSLYNSPLIWW